MGSFGWDDQCYTQYYKGQPLSVALTEPCRCQSACYTDSDFTLERHDTHHARSHSTGGRRFKREAYSIYHPNVQYATYYHSPSFFHRSMDHGFGRDAFVEKYVTFEEEQCRPTQRVISYVRAASPLVRHVKIRSRPSSCVDLHKSASTDNQWKKVVDERTEEHYNYHYNYTPPVQQAVATNFRYDATTGTDDLHIKPKPVVRPATRDASTETIKRPLSISETQVIERYEKDEKIRRDLAAETTSTTYITMEQQQAIKPVQRTYEDTVTETTSTSYSTQQQQQQQEAIQRSYGSSITGSASSGGFLSTQIQPSKHSYGSSITGSASSGGFLSTQIQPSKHSYGSSITETASSGGFMSTQQPIKHSYGSSRTETASSGGFLSTQIQPSKHSYGSSITETASSGGFLSTHQQPIQHSYSSSMTETSGGDGYRSIPLQPLQTSFDNSAIGTSSTSYTSKYHQPIVRSYDSSATEKSSTGYLTTQQPIHRTFDTSVLGTSSSSYSATEHQPIQRSSDDDDLSDDHQNQRVHKKVHRKEFVQRMHARNGTALKSYNAFSTNTDRGRGRTIVRPTAKPREALVDTPGITGNPGDISEPSTPTVSFEKNMRSRNYFQST